MIKKTAEFLIVVFATTTKRNSFNNFNELQPNH